MPKLAEGAIVTIPHRTKPGIDHNLALPVPLIGFSLHRDLNNGSHNHSPACLASLVYGSFLYKSFIFSKAFDVFFVWIRRLAWPFCPGVFSLVSEPNPSPALM